MSAGIIRRGVPHTQLAVRVQGITIGWVTGFRVDESYNQFPIKVLGDAFTQVHELVDITVSGSCEKFRIYTEPLVHIRDGNGNRLWYDQAQDTPALIRLLEREMVLATTAEPGSPPLYTVIGWKPSGRSLSVGQGGVLMENFSWVAIRVLESDVRVNLGG
jgi:hypothetical protein